MKDPDGESALESWFTSLLEWDSGQPGGPSGIIRYGAHPSQLVELWLPEVPNGLQAVLSLHGGYFLEEYDRTIHHPMVRSLCQRGFVVANVEYRRAGGGGDVDATTADVWAAATAVSERLGLSSFAAVGHSAGGYLAEWLATHPAVDAVVALAAVSDLAAASRAGWDDGAIAHWVGAHPDTDPEAYARSELTRRLPTGARHVLLHGTEDTAVGVQASRDYAGALLGAGEAVRFEELPGSGHYGYLDPREADFERVVAALMPEVP